MVTEPLAAQITDFAKGLPSLFKTETAPAPGRKPTPPGGVPNNDLGNVLGGILNSSDSNIPSPSDIENQGGFIIVPQTDQLKEFENTVKGASGAAEQVGGALGDQLLGATVQQATQSAATTTVGTTLAAALAELTVAAAAAAAALNAVASSGASSGGGGALGAISGIFGGTSGGAGGAGGGPDIISSVFASGGGTPFAGGGSVRGGVRGKDSVPSLLMPEEFVVRANIASKNRGFLRKFNAGVPVEILMAQMFKPRALGGFANDNLNSSPRAFSTPNVIDFRRPAEGASRSQDVDRDVKRAAQEQIKTSRIQRRRLQHDPLRVQTQNGEGHTPRQNAGIRNTSNLKAFG